MDVGDHTTSSNGSLDQSIEFFVTADSQLEVTGSYSLHLQVFASVAGKLEHLSSEVLKNSSSVDCRCGSNTAVRAHSTFQESVNSANWELKKKLNWLALSTNKSLVAMDTLAHLVVVALTCSPALADLDWGLFLDFPMPNLPPFPPFPFPPA